MSPEPSFVQNADTSVGLGSVTLTGRSVRSRAYRNSARPGELRAVSRFVTTNGIGTSIAPSPCSSRKPTTQPAPGSRPSAPETKKSKKMSRRISPSVMTSTPACSWMRSASSTAASSAACSSAAPISPARKPCAPPRARADAAWSRPRPPGTPSRPPSLPLASPTGAAKCIQMAEEDLHLHASVHGPDLAGDVGGLVLAEEVHDAGDLLRLAKAGQRDLALDHVEDLLRHGGDHIGVDVARGDGVDRQPGAALEPARLLQGVSRLAGERHREAEHAGLRRRVVRLADVALLADDRGDVHDPAAAAVDHVLQGRLGH